MEISIIAALMIVGIIIQHLLKIKENRMEREDGIKARQQSVEPDTIGLMFNTFNALGCQPTKNDDGTLSVSYQGENFHTEFGGRYARVWDPMWAGFKADDPDMPKIREAVNAANFNFGPTVVLTSSDDEGVIGIHSRRDIMLHPACPDNVPFVKAVLDSFFDAKEEVRNRYQQINARQMEDKKNRRPVGFATNTKKQTMTLKTFPIFAIVAVAITGCSHNKTEDRIQAPPFPYEYYLELSEEDQVFPKIGYDGEGFDAISDNIRYPELPAELSLSHFADSLLLLYNTALAFNTMAYDISTAERYINEKSICKAQADALDSINLSGIKNTAIKDALLAVCNKFASWIREGEKPNGHNYKEVKDFYEVYNKFSNPFLEAYLSDVEYDPSKIIENYNEMHQKAITDTLSYRYELLKQVRAELDFQKRCVLAREFAYANFKSKERNDKELVAIIDPILRSNEYSPLLYDLWLMWRTALQKNILGSPSNDGAMYNLFYNDMRNHVAVLYITFLKSNPHDKIAFNKFVSLASEYNITRNSPCYLGNNSILDEMSIYDECWNNNKSENEN